MVVRIRPAIDHRLRTQLLDVDFGGNPKVIETAIKNVPADYHKGLEPLFKTGESRGSNIAIGPG